MKRKSAVPSVRILFLVLALLPAGLATGASPPVPETQFRKISAGGLERTFWLHVPKTLAKPAPLLFAFHGGGNKGETMECRALFNALSEREGFLVAYPDGFDGNWNDGRTGDFSEAHRTGVDDLAFVRAMIDALSREFPVDPDRVFATGISNGGFMSHWVGANLADKFAAIVPVIGGIGDGLAASFRPSEPVSVMIIQGVADPLVPYHGGIVSLPFGKTRGRLVDTDKAAAMWAAADGCGAVPSKPAYLPDKAPLDGCRIRKTSWTGGKNGAEVVLLAVEGGGHTWPGGTQYLPKSIVGNVCRDADLTLAWEFMKAHPKRRPAPPSKADLVVDGVSATVAGRGVFVMDTVKNAGGSPAPAFTISYRLVRDGAASSAGVLLGSRKVEGLAPGASSSGAVSFVAPLLVAPGSYRIRVVADEAGAVPESDEGNNAVVSGTVTIGRRTAAR